jgi:hypothetical protein
MFENMPALVRIIRGRIRGAANVEMAQIAQRGAIFCAHTASKVGVFQMLIARELRHVLENAQALLDGLLSRWRQIAPVWQHVILNVIPLLRRHLLPHPFAVAQVLLLLWRQLPKTSLILDDALSIFGAETLLIISVGIVIVLPASGILPVS